MELFMMTAPPEEGMLYVVPEMMVAGEPGIMV